LTAGKLGHSRRLHLRMFLALIQETRPVSELMLEATALFDVGERAVEQALSDLETAGYLSRVRAREGDRRRMFGCLTPLGRRALGDPSVAEALIGLPKLQRKRRGWVRDPLNPARVEAKLEEWRRAMRA
jgi:DNA-binding PadR family transcriptional regulator